MKNKLCYDPNCAECNPELIKELMRRDHFALQFALANVEKLQDHPGKNAPVRKQRHIAKFMADQVLLADILIAELAKEKA